MGWSGELLLWVLASALLPLLPGRAVVCLGNGLGVCTAISTASIARRFSMMAKMYSQKPLDLAWHSVGGWGMGQRHEKEWLFTLARAMQKKPPMPEAPLRPSLREPPKWFSASNFALGTIISLSRKWDHVIRHGYRGQFRGCFYRRELLPASLYSSGIWDAPLRSCTGTTLGEIRLGICRHADVLWNIALVDRDGRESVARTHTYRPRNC